MSTSSNDYYVRLTLAGLHLINNVLRNTTGTRSALIVYPIYSSSRQLLKPSRYIFSYDTGCEDYLASFWEVINTGVNSLSFETRAYEALNFLATNGDIDGSRDTAVITVTDGPSEPEDTRISLIEQAIVNIRSRSSNVRFLSAGIPHISFEQSSIFIEELNALSTNIPGQMYLHENTDILDFITGIVNLMDENGLIFPVLSK